MAKPGAPASQSAPSPAERKLRRVVHLLARAEARDWMAGHTANSLAAGGASAVASIDPNSTENATHAD